MSGEYYSDAITVQLVSKLSVRNFNFVAGLIPFIRELIADVSI